LAGTASSFPSGPLPMSRPPRPLPGLAAVLPVALPLFLVGCGGPDEAPGDLDDRPTRDSTTIPAAPETDIWIAPLDGHGRELRLGTARNATDRPGYDNQPVFTGPGRLLYTRAEDGDADIWQLDLATGVTTPFTRTSPESEYSATPLPFAAGISVVQVEADSTQRLWQIDGAGVPVAPIFPGVAPVGYHAWLDDTRALLYVLGNPATLHLAERGATETRVVARDVGRSLQAAPGGGVSYVQRTDEGSTEIRIWSREDGDSRRVAESVAVGEDHAWTPDGLLLQASGNRVYALDPAGDRRWREIGGVEGDRRVTRMAVSPDGRTLAMVVTGS